MSTQRTWNLVNLDLSNIKPPIQKKQRETPSHYKNLATRFGQWKRLSEPYWKSIGKGNYWYVDVECTCGTRHAHKIHNLTSGKTEKCIRCGAKQSAERYSAKYRQDKP